MFERNRVDNNVQQRAVTVEITLVGQSPVSGNIVVARSKSLAEVLNGPSGFIEFEPFDGDRYFIAKSTIQSIKPVDVPATASLKAMPAGGDGFDPYDVLGLGKAATADEVRKAYHKLTMTYHTDRYASADLPQEVQVYLQSMARRINAAYGVVQEEIARSEKYAAMRTAPIYERRHPE